MGRVERYFRQTIEKRTAKCPLCWSIHVGHRERAAGEVDAGRNDAVVHVHSVCCEGVLRCNQDTNMFSPNCQSVPLLGPEGSLRNRSVCFLEAYDVRGEVT